ncbi:acyl-CoA dehydrogenase family protein [Lentibacillus sp.]|uniref:acyl-CoA dehydrogenase family protein n=1 Tax=Lentibacillus sp. TaxID=1925746 RepID=UPI002B4AB90C|nr:acyl-CoA dehydrogenase family protein [Lentibacillus sp.]HLS09146.1 acyl-CoA dehydrogenase family protein [Lentibacillus sp.]
MISFQPTEEETSFIKVAKDFAKNRIRPSARKCEEQRAVDKALSDEAAELGFLSLELSDNLEGLELPLITQVQLIQVLSYGDLDIIQGLRGTGDAASFFRLLRDNPILDGYKNALANGATAAFIDMENTKEPWAKQLSIRNDHDGYVLQGVSQPVLLAAFADYAVVALKDSQGNSVVLWLDDTVDWTIQQGDYRLGLLASGLGRFSFENVKIPGSHVFAEGQAADDLLRTARTRIRVLQAAKEVGLMEAALDYATEYTAERKAFGREVAKFQGVSFRVASMTMETRMANHLVLEAAVKTDENDPAAERLSLRALHRAHRSLRYVTDSAVQLLGGHGFVQDFPAEKWMRDAQAQVALYGREHDLLVRYGEQLIAGEKEVTAT